MTASLQKAVTLYHLHKYSLALKELNAVLAEQPNEGLAYCYRSLVFLQRKQAKEALENGQKAIGLIPEHADGHYVVALVHLTLTKDYRKAESSIREALRLAPEEPEYYDVLANLMLMDGDYPEAAALCEKGLKINPLSVHCLSTRARALARMGKNEEAETGLTNALKADPRDVQALATAGWVRLEIGEHKRALETFRDALRIEPGYEYAREGMVQAVKARNLLFRVYLRWVFWQDSRLGTAVRIAVLIPVVIVARVVGLLGIVFLFMLSTWLVDPVTNLFLRFDKFGKYALSRSETIASNRVAACLLLGVAMEAGAIYWRSSHLWHFHGTWDCGGLNKPERCWAPERLSAELQRERMVK